jgi:hypothetical protein
MLFHYLVRLSAIFISTFLFVACHSVVDPTTFHEDCMYDMCACSENIRDCLCPMIGEYAKQCAASGIEIKWRNHIPECRKFAELSKVWPYGYKTFENEFGTHSSKSSNQSLFLLYSVF